ncbi:uncharacterized protein A4U43_UnF6830 [Asparagus officinalis]|uniref:Uncharacterized protein n=1 Tax=Asparagus officinalis TaxID=4686 RepID=A0A1R3L6C7_ASPOF|nr:uncharacterized protein A4U43_UnF6830 [Asparagus officinalis]
MWRGLSHENARDYQHKTRIAFVEFVMVVDYLLGETKLPASSSDSDDSDSDGSSLITQRMRKLWAYPKLASTEEMLLG